MAGEDKDWLELNFSVCLSLNLSSLDLETTHFLKSALILKLQTAHNLMDQIIH